MFLNNRRTNFLLLYLNRVPVARSRVGSKGSQNHITGCLLTVRESAHGGAGSKEEGLMWESWLERKGVLFSFKH